MGFSPHPPAAAHLLPVAAAALLLAAALFPTVVGWWGRQADLSVLGWVASLLSSLRPQLVVVSAVAAVMFLAAWRPVPALLAGVASAVAAVPVLSAAVGPASPQKLPDSPGGSLVVRFHNLNDNNPDVAAAVRSAVSASDGEEPHLVAFFETPLSSREAFEAVEAELRPGWRRLYGEFRPSGAGMVLYSRLPVVSAEHLELPSGRPAAQAVVELEGGPIRLLFAHPVSPRSLSLHVSQADDLSYLAGLLEVSPLPAVLFGDLNVTTHSSLWVPFRTRGLVSAVSSSTWSYLPGTPLESLASLGIDHVVFDPDRVAVSSPRLGGWAGSDHRPVSVEVAPMSAR